MYLGYLTIHNSWNADGFFGWIDSLPIKLIGVSLICEFGWQSVDNDVKIKHSFLLAVSWRLGWGY